MFRAKVRTMTGYTIKTAVVDLGFIDGYCRTEDMPSDDGMFECVLHCLDGMIDYVIDGRVLAGDSQDAKTTARFLHDLGFIRGWLWTKPIPHAISEAFSRVIDFATGNEFAERLTCHETTTEPKSSQLSEDQRDKMFTAGENGDDCASKEFAESIGASHEGVVNSWQRFGVFNKEEAEQELKGDAEPQTPATDAVTDTPTAVFNPHNPNGKRGRRQWTDAQRAEASERAKGQKKPPFDEHFAEVKADFDAGMSPGAIGNKWNCSDGHIRNFLTKNGIDPRRPKVSISAYQPTPREEYEWTDESRAKLFELLDQGMTWKDIGDHLRRTPSACRSMHALLVKEGMAPPKKPPADATPALNAEDIPEVQKMLDRDSSYDEIGEWFGCDAEAVRQFCQDNKLIPKHLQEKASRDYELRQANQPRIAVPPRWKADPIDPNDWPDIQQMLATGRSREAIAGDYDVPVEDLNAFIAERLESARKRREPPPGESQPSSLTMAGTAA
jgi:hypothetical protein